MSQKLQNSLLEAGIIPAGSVKEMEQWQAVPNGSAEKIGEFSPQKVQGLREEIELQSLPTLRETVLDVDKIMAKGRPVTLLVEGSAKTIDVTAGVDIMQRYIVPIPQDSGTYQYVTQFMRTHAIIHDESLESPRDVRRITEISVLYSTVEEGASIPTHWFCVTRSQGEESIVRGR